MITIPYLIFKISPPSIKDIPDAHGFASEKLKEMGVMKSQEWIMLSVFIGLVALWALGGHLGINSVTTAFLGVAVLLVTGVLTLNELLAEKSAWGTFLWFGVLLTLASYLNSFGVIGYFSELIGGMVQGMNWRLAFLILSLLYFYSHYAFASSMAHVGAMYSAFLSLSITLGTPPFLAAILLAFYSSLYGGLTHYGIGSGPVLFGAGYVGLKEWWKVGFILSVVNVLIWTVVGTFWWSLLGYVDFSA